MFFVLCNEEKADDPMEKIFEQGLLYDFYGELLTPHQRSIYEDAVFNDMSLGEIAKERGISRQGVHDLIRRCDRILQDYESKLHLVARFAKAKETIGRIVMLAKETSVQDGQVLSEVNALSKEAEAVTREDIKGRMEQICRLSQELMREL